jgi:hypothetical protein
MAEATKTRENSQETSNNSPASFAGQPGSSGQAQQRPSPFHLPSQRLAEVQRILSWPAVEKLLQCELNDLQLWESATLRPEAWLSKITEDFGHPLTLEDRITISCEPTFSRPSMPGVTHLDRGTISELCEAFFASFHCLYPILDQTYFESTLLPQVIDHSFSESDQASSLVLLVLALGSVAQQGSIGLPVVDGTNGRPTGIKGGSAESPPGLVFIHEALRRVGLHLSACNLIMLQTYILTAQVPASKGVCASH